VDSFRFRAARHHPNNQHLSALQLRESCSRWVAVRRRGGPLLNAVHHTLYIAPGAPWQNAYVESFNSRFRAEALNQESIADLGGARQVSAWWQNHYTHRGAALVAGVSTAGDLRSGGPNRW
jgi:transposase InsO family protein